MSRTLSESRRKDFDVMFLRTFPGIFFIIQLACCCLAFVLGITGSYYKSGPHIFFILVVAVASSTTGAWIAIHFCEVKNASLLKGISWNKAAIIHSGVHSFLVMVGSICMTEYAFVLRPLRAAGVFGFFAFTAYLVHFCWEVTRYVETSLPSKAVVRATISKGHNKEPSSPIIEKDQDENFFEPTFEGSFKPRPQSTLQSYESSGQPEMNCSVAIDKPSNLKTVHDSDSFDSDDSLNKNTKKNVYNFT